MTLQEVANAVGYSVAAINGLELRNEGGYKFKILMNQFYGNNNPVPYSEIVSRPAMTLHEDAVPYRVSAPPPKEKVDYGKVLKKLEQLQAQLDALQKTIHDNPP